MREILKRVISMKIRRRRRYRAGNGLYVVVNQSSGKYQIDDIGLGGLSFHCVDTGDRPRTGSYDFKIVCSDQPMSVELKGRIVAENETGEMIYPKKKIKRRSVRFERVSRHKLQDLKTLINQCPTM